MAEQAKNVLIVFDLVATLTDAGPRYAQAFRDVAEKAGHAAPDADEVLSMLGDKNLSEITDHFAGGMKPDEKKKFMTECNDACDIMLKRPDWKESLFPHVRETIVALHTQGMHLGIFTGTREDAMAAQLKHHGITQLFDTQYVRGKNNERDAGKKNDVLKAEQLHAIAEEFRKGQGARIIVVGDSSADAKAAAQEGLPFIGFATNDKKKAELTNAGVAFIMTDFDQLPAMVDRLLAPPLTNSGPNPAQKRP